MTYAHRLRPGHLPSNDIHVFLLELLPAHPLVLGAVLLDPVELPKTLQLRSVQGLASRDYLCHERSLFGFLLWPFEQAYLSPLRCQLWVLVDVVTLQVVEG